MNVTVVMVSCNDGSCDCHVFKDDDAAIQDVVNMVQDSVDPDDVEDMDEFLNCVVKDLRDYRSYDDGTVVYRIMHRTISE